MSVTEWVGVFLETHAALWRFSQFILLSLIMLSNFVQSGYTLIERINLRHKYYVLCYVKISGTCSENIK